MRATVDDFQKSDGRQVPLMIIISMCYMGFLVLASALDASCLVCFRMLSLYIGPMLSAYAFFQAQSSVFYFLHGQAGSVGLTVPYAPTYLVEGRKSRFISRCCCRPFRTNVQKTYSVSVSVTTRTGTSTCRLPSVGICHSIQSRSRRKRKHANQGCFKTQAKLPVQCLRSILLSYPVEFYFGSTLRYTPTPLSSSLSCCKYVQVWKQ